MKLLQTEGLTKSFQGRCVVDHVSLEVAPGEIVGLLGKNGAGKTTTFRMIMGTLRPDEGKILFEGKDISHLPMYKRVRLGIGYLAQEAAIFRSLTVEDNLHIILEARGIRRKERKKIVSSVLEELGIEKLRKNLAGSLSGGERKRLEIARVLSLSPKLILLDEPFAAVDPIARREIKEIIFSLSKRQIGILMTDHNEREILTTTSRSYIIDKGLIIAAGTTQEILASRAARGSYLGEDFQL